ncbi:hypothetical protein D3C86_2007390 [compost metagenome]
MWALARKTCPDEGGLLILSSETGSGSLMTTWALAPPKPNELMPASRARLPRKSSIGLAVTRTFKPSKSMCSFGVSKCSDAGR